MFSQLVVVGLGNPGSKYLDTRHNVGFMVVSALVTRCDGRFMFANRAMERAQIRVADVPVTVVKPLIYMNRSGGALASLRQGGYEFEPGEVLVVADDIALPLGRLRLRKKGSDGGHNGLKSVIDVLGSPNFGRLRVGVGEPSGGGAAADYVLSPFSRDEMTEVERVVDRAVDCIEDLLACGFEHAMGRFNAAGALPEDPDSD